MALMEHASVAAFARFALDLLAVAAPSDLVAAAAEAGRDELRHARLCFSLASAYRGSPLAPGPLSLEGCVAPADLATIVETTVIEGCVGETVAALEARELARQVSDPVLAAVLATIAEDEARHAALAWRFVQWALTREGTRVRSVVDRILLALAPEADEHVACVDDRARYGLLGKEATQAIRARALRDVVLPCAQVLLAARTNSSGPRGGRQDRSDAVTAV
jgi:hypothetical protein